MKRLILLSYGILFSLIVFGQQIGNGITPRTTLFDDPLPSGMYSDCYWTRGGLVSNFYISAKNETHNFQLRSISPQHTSYLPTPPLTDRIQIRLNSNSASNPANWIDIATCGYNKFTETQLINGKLGIKNENPAYDVDVNGTGNFTGNLLTSGNLGIKTTNPAYDLDVVGRGRFTNNLLTSGRIGIKNMSPVYDLDVSGTGRFTNNLLITGKVGIKTTNPTYELDVNGTIRGKEVRVESNWADFVFDKDYKLPALDEVKAHIEEHKHLPGMPSAIEVKENGIGLSEATALLLQKVEELTLYVIQQNEKMDGQNNLLKEQSSQIKEQNDRIEKQNKQILQLNQLLNTKN